MTSLGLTNSWSWTVRPAGTTIPPPWLDQRQELGVQDGLCRPSSRYSNCHWNWPATARILVCASAELRSTSLRVCHEMTNMKMTISVGTTVQTSSAMLLPWVWGGSVSSPGLRR